MSKKVYCNDCKWFKDEDNGWEGYAPAVCEGKLQIVDDVTHRKYQKRVYIQTGKPNYPNQGNGCEYYQRKWWKWWVK